ncbi:MAG: formylmethanofuran dehydrogenase subunit C [Hyphomicrobium sp.]|jgi:formylmethanofuran dehydrogenase subunit C
MSGLTFRLNAAPAERLDLSHLTPKRLSSTPLAEVLKFNVGSTKSALTVGDVFAVSGRPGDTVRIESGSARLDHVGADLDHGTIIVDGDVGVAAGRNMRGGRLEIKGDAGALLGSGISGGQIIVKGSAAGQVGGLSPGDKFGMTGGLIAIDGQAGDRAGDRMRRGTIFIRGKCGAFAGSRMVGGTIWTELGFGADPGLLLRRGTLIGPSVEQMLPTFADSGKHDLVILRILSRYMREVLGAQAPRPLSGNVRKYAGDLATIGKGEILLTS